MWIFNNDVIADFAIMIQTCNDYIDLIGNWLQHLLQI